jgi:hypothetical protein
VFVDRWATGVELRVYEDRMEVQSAGATGTLVLRYRHVRTVVPSGQGGSEALAIIGRSGEVLLVPMDPDQITTAEWLISGVIEWADSARTTGGQPPATRASTLGRNLQVQDVEE